MFFYIKIELLCASQYSRGEFIEQNHKINQQQTEEVTIQLFDLTIFFCLVCYHLFGSMVTGNT